MNASRQEMKWAIVTGASSGIGLQFCHRLAEMGYSLVMVSNQPEALALEAEALGNKYGVETTPVLLDLTAEDACERLCNSIDIKRIEPEVLINNAGIFSFEYLTKTPDGKINTFVDLHMRAVARFSTEFARRFAARGKGYILNMSSMSCWMPMPGLAMYASTKAFIRVFSRSLHYEMRGSGVSVTVACPGGIATDLFGLPDHLKRLALRLGAIATPEKFARSALQKMFKGKAQYINGFTNRLAIVLVSSLPRSVKMLVRSKMLDKNITKP